MTSERTSGRIRPMRIGDIDHVMAVAEGLKQAPRWTRDVYEQALAPGSHERFALIAETVDGKIAGFVIAGLIPPQAELETIAVAAELQRQGIASRLIQELMGELQKRHITEVMLEVRVSNYAARALYCSLGFVETGRRRGYYADPQEDALLLQRPLP